MPDLVSATSALLYLLATAGSLSRLLTREPGSLRRWLPFAVLALALHVSTLFQSGSFAELRFSQALSLVCVLIAIGLLLLAIRERIEVLCTLFFPLAAVAVLLPETPGSVAPLRWPLSLHVGLALLAYSVLALASLQALLVAWQDRLLRRHRNLRWLLALPPLSDAERLLFTLIGSGFALLTLALLAGAVFVENLLAQHLAHKTVLSVIAWLVFATLLWGRRVAGWRGRQAVRWTLVGMGFLVLAFFGSKFVLELLLERT